MSANNSTKRILNIWRMDEGNTYPTYVVEAKGDKWMSWTNKSIYATCYFLEKMVLCLSKEPCHFYNPREMVRRELIEAIKAGKYNHCLIAKQHK